MLYELARFSWHVGGSLRIAKKSGDCEEASEPHTATVCSNEDNRGDCLPKEGGQ
jgi:hypothetical protein